MSVPDWAGPRQEYAVRASSPDFESYVADIRDSREIAVARVAGHRSPGITVDVVERTVTYGPWRTSSDSSRTGGEL